VQLLLTQQQKQKQKGKPAAITQDGAADIFTQLVTSWSMFVNAWAASSPADRQNADCLQIALQVAESGARKSRYACLDMEVDPCVYLVGFSSCTIV
jgi:hypothetical protein